MNTKKVVKCVCDRLREPSTLRGLALLATVAGAPPGAIDQSLQVGLAIVGLLGTLPDPKGCQ